MKKFLTLLMALCLMVGVLCIGVYAGAQDPAAGTVMRVIGVEQTSANAYTSHILEDFDNFEDGWNYAMDLAGDEDEMEENNYGRVLVEVYADWVAVAGEFTDDWINGDGFKWDTIFVPENARVTLNLNGHTIDRGLTNVWNNGEVICISDEADVIINNGTIKGGFAEYGAGGIHIMDDANVTLNDVHFVGNTTMWDGGAIAVSDGSTLTVNGGSFENNSAAAGKSVTTSYGGAVYVEDATAVFDGVEFKGNNGPSESSLGAAIYADNSDVTIKNCTFEGNGVARDSAKAADSVIHGVDSTIKVTASTFKDNGGEVKDGGCDYSALFALGNSTLAVDESEISGNLSYFIFNDVDGSKIRISNTKMVDNKSAIMCGDTDTSVDSYFEVCTFENNGKFENVSFYEIASVLTFYNCSMGDCIFASDRFVRFFDDVPESDVVLSVSALKNDGTTELIADYNSFENGWNAAMKLAMDSDTMTTKGYDRVVVDIHRNWNAQGGQFTSKFFNGVGFDWDAIYVQPGVKITLNLNGHTIDRGLESWQENGEVICVDDNADLIINNGTITGGDSGNGAGGIHINDGAKVTLNDVHVDGNVASADDGAAIAVYDDATLIMNGGSISNNTVYAGLIDLYQYYGSVFVEDSTAIFNNVEFKNNVSVNRENSNSKGIAIYAKNSDITINNCTFDGNGYTETEDGPITAASNLEFHDCDVTIKDSTFTNNRGSVLIDYDGTEIDIENCVITKNRNAYLLRDSSFSTIHMTNTQIVDNVGRTYDGGYWGDGVEYFKNCVINNNDSSDGCDFTLFDDVTFEDCDLGDSTFFDADGAIFVNTEVPAGFPKGAGSIFNDNTPATSLSLIALVVAIVSVGTNFVCFKKKTNTESK